MNQSLKNLVCEEKRGKGLVPNEDMGKENLFVFFISFQIG